MKLRSLGKPSIDRMLRGPDGLNIRIGEFVVSLKSPLKNVSEHLFFFYGDYQALDRNRFIDFHVSLYTPSLVRKILRPQVVFSLDGYVPFKPLPYDQASAMFEWGLNWCIANHSNQYLIIHAAVIEKNGHAIIFPGSPGSGKSTLCAALVLDGWRLLSDEMALILVDDGMVYPVPRPISLKNNSIELIRNLSEKAVLGHVVSDTAKGTVGHMRPSMESVEQLEPAKPSFLIFPKYKPQSVTTLTELSKGQAMIRAANDSFNYNILGEVGFNVLVKLVDQCQCHTFEYCELQEALGLFSQMVD